MDRAIEKKKLSAKNLVIYVFLGLTALIGVYGVISTDFSTPSIGLDKVRIGEVKRGHLQVKVAGNGVIVAKDPEWVVSKVPGQVIKLHVKAGDTIKRGDILAELINDDIRSAAARSRSELSASNADLTAKHLDLNSQRIALESELKVAELNHKKVMALFNIHSKLMRLENAPISELEFVQTSIELDQMEGLLNLAKTRLANFEDVERAQLHALQFRESSIKEENEQLTRRASELNIVASKTGVVQNFDIKVGETVIAGDILAQIVDPSSVYVTLDIPALQAYKLALLKKVEIELNRKTVAGKVQRIDPNVRGTTVEVDVHLDEEILDARIGMFVNGSVLVNEMQNTIFVDIPSRAPEYSNASVFVLSPDGKFANLINIRTGARSSNHLEIVDGLQPGDRIILSEPSGLEGVTKVRLN